MTIKGRDHVIDLVRNTVTKNNYQKFKFEALRPFESLTKVEFSNVSADQTLFESFLTRYVFLFSELIPSLSSSTKHIVEQDLYREAQV